MIKKLHWSIIAVLFLTLGSCSSSAPEPDDPTPGPHQTLIKIVQMAQKNNFDGIENLVMGIQYQGKNSADQIIDGIKNAKKDGDFSFSIESFQYIIHKARLKILPIGDEALNDLFLDKKAPFANDSFFSNYAKNHREKIYHYQEGLASLVLIEVQGTWKLIFSEEVAALVRKNK